MKIYISGAISSDQDYYRKFQEAALRIRKAGHIVICPTCLPDGLSYDDYMHVDYALIDISDAVFFLKDWTGSPGANDEYRYANHAGKIIFFEADGYEVLAKWAAA